MQRIIKILAFLGILLLAGYVAADHFGTKFARQKLDAAIARVSDKVTVTYSSVTLNLLRLDLTVHNVGLRFPDDKYLSIRRVVVEDMDLTHGSRPQSLTAHLEGLNLNVNHVNFGEDFEDIQSLGYYALNADLRFSYAWNPEARTFRIDDLELAMEDVGDVTLTLALENVDLDTLRNKQFEDLLIKELDLTYADRSLIKKLTLIAAEDEQEFMDFIVSGLRYDAEAARREYDENTARSLTELIAFLERPQPFSLEMHLLQPVDIGSIMTTKKISYIRQLFLINFHTG